MTETTLDNPLARNVNAYMRGDLSELEHRQMTERANHYKNNFFNVRDVREDYDFDDEDVIRGKSRDDLFEERYGANSYNLLQGMYHDGRIRKLNRHEMDLLRFCHGIDVKRFIKEEFERNPIELGHDEHGNICIKNGKHPTNIDDDREL